MTRTWPADWDARRAGQDCFKCTEGRPDDDQWGVRFYAGHWADAYGRPLPDQVFAHPAVLSAEQLTAQIAALRCHIDAAQLGR